MRLKDVARELVAAEQIDAAPIAARSAPGSASFMTGIWPSGSKGEMVEAKIAVNSQNRQMPTPTMPTPLSNSWP